jgi:hypothetical protein
MQGVDVATVVAGVLAIIILVDVSVLVIMGKPVPEILSNLAFGVFGFYFGRRGPAGKAEGADVEEGGGGGAGGRGGGGGGAGGAVAAGPRAGAGR